MFFSANVSACVTVTFLFSGKNKWRYSSPSYVTNFYKYNKEKHSILKKSNIFPETHQLIKYTSFTSSSSDNDNLFYYTRARPEILVEGTNWFHRPHYLTSTYTIDPEKWTSARYELRTKEIWSFWSQLALQYNIFSFCLLWFLFPFSFPAVTKYSKHFLLLWYPMGRACFLLVPRSILVVFV